MRYPRSPQVAWVSKFTLQSSPFLKKEGSCRCLPLCLCFCVCVCVCVCQSVCAGVLVDEYPVTTGHFCVMNLAELDSSFLMSMNVQKLCQTHCPASSSECPRCVCRWAARNVGFNDTTHCCHTRKQGALLGIHLDTLLTQ